MVFGPVGSFAVVSALENGFLFFSIKPHFSAGNALWAVLCGVSRAKLCFSTVALPQCRFGAFFPAQCVGNKSAYFCAARPPRKEHPLQGQKRPQHPLPGVFSASRGCTRLFAGTRCFHRQCCGSVLFSGSTPETSTFVTHGAPQCNFWFAPLSVTKVLIFCPKKRLHREFPHKNLEKKFSRFWSKHRANAHICHVCTQTQRSQAK